MMEVKGEEKGKSLSTNTTGIDNRAKTRLPGHCRDNEIIIICYCC